MLDTKIFSILVLVSISIHRVEFNYAPNLNAMKGENNMAYTKLTFHRAELANIQTNLIPGRSSFQTVIQGKFRSFVISPDGKKIHATFVLEASDSKKEKIFNLAVIEQGVFELSEFQWTEEEYLDLSNQVYMALLDCVIERANTLTDMAAMPNVAASMLKSNVVHAKLSPELKKYLANGRKRLSSVKA